MGARCEVRRGIRFKGALQYGLRSTHPRPAHFMCQAGRRAVDQVSKYGRKACSGGGAVTRLTPTNRAADTRKPESTGSTDAAPNSSH